MDTLGESIPVYGMVKDSKHRTRGLTDENEELPIDREGNLFKFLTCMQDEVNRFAIAGYHKKHEKSTLHSELEEIPGIGPAKRNKLMQTFLSIDRLRQADFAELCAGVDKTSARRIIDYFNGGGTEDES